MLPLAQNRSYKSLLQRSLSILVQHLLLKCPEIAAMVATKQAKLAELTPDEIKAGVESYIRLFGSSADTKVSAHISQELRDRGESFRHRFLIAIKAALAIQSITHGSYAAGVAGAAKKHCIPPAS
jgi:hypothetical protein